MTDVNNLKTISFTSCLCNSDDKPIKGTEDARIIVTTPQQLSFLKDKT